MIDKTTSLVIILLVFTSSGCLQNQGDDEGVPTLRIISYDAFGVTEQMLAEFTNESGIEIVLTKKGDAGSVLSSVIHSKDTGLYDLAIGIDNSYLGAALAAEVFQPMNIDRSSLSERALSSYDGNLAIPFDVGSVCINYDSTFVDGENISIPTSLWNFTEPNWSGKIALQNPRTSSPGRSFLIATIEYFENDGDDSTDYTDWWSAMKANEAIITNGWTEAYEVHYSAGYGQWGDGFIGDARAVVSYCHSPGVEAYFGGNWTTSTSLNLSGASFGQIEYATYLVGAKSSEETAETFVKWLISSEINSQMPTLNYMYPAISGGDLPTEAGYRYHSVVPTDVSISPTEINANITDWLDYWDTAMA